MRARRLSRARQSPVQSVLIVEPDWHGHRLAYVKYIASYALAQGMDVSIAMGDGATDSPEFAVHLEALRGRVTLLSLGILPSQPGGRYNAWLVRQIRSLMSAEASNAVVVTEGDKALPRLGLARLSAPHRLRVIMMRAPRVRGAWRDARQAGKAVAAALCQIRGIAVLALCPATPVSAAYRLGVWPAVPDPVSTDPGADVFAQNLSKRLAPTRYWFGVFGHITARKNVPLILDALSSLDPASVGLLIAGRVDERISSEIERACAAFEAVGGAVELLGGTLSDAALDGAIVAVGAAVVAHHAEGPSGILGKAAAVGTWVVASGAGSLRSDAERLEWGSWSPLDREALAANMALAQASTPRRRPRALAGPGEFAAVLFDTHRSGK